jgi:CheY-like chemotaxis protein
MRVPRILLVDDERQVSRMLRTSLELSGRECVVVDVPSGEEALLELNRGPVDLLVTDLRLPGISGLQLLFRLREINPDARSILITGHPSAEARAQAEAMGVIAFLPKPLSTNFFLEAVDRALNLSRPRETLVRVPDEGKALMANRLMEVLTEQGAIAAYVVDENGKLVVQAGDLADVNLKSAVGSLTLAFRSSLKVSQVLGALLPFNFQFFDGDVHVVYLTNVGSYYALLVVFEGKQSPTRMGEVYQVLRKAADDILTALSRIGSGSNAESAGEREKQKAPVTPPPQLAPKTGKPVSKEVGDFWDQAVSGKQARNASEGSIPFDEAQRRGLIKETPEE